MGIIARCKDILKSNMNYKKVRNNVDDMNKLLGNVKAQKLAYETRYNRMKAEAQSYEDDIDKYKRYLERANSAQVRTFQARLDKAQADLDRVNSGLPLVYKRYQVLDATFQKLESDIAAVPGKVYADAESLQRMVDMADSLEDLESDPELDALMSKYQ